MQFMLPGLRLRNKIFSISLCSTSAAVADNAKSIQLKADFLSVFGEPDK